MFEYNTLSDLKTGELVTPLRKDGDYIICLNSNKKEIKVSFDEFDFDKTVDERLIVVKDVDIIDNSSEEIEEETNNNSNDEETEVEINNSSDKEETKKEINYKNNFIEDNDEKIEIIKKFGFSYDNINKVNIWKAEVL